MKVVQKFRTFLPSESVNDHIQRLLRIYKNFTPWIKFLSNAKFEKILPNCRCMYLHIGKFWCQFGLIAPSSDWQLTCSVFWWHLPSTLFPFNLNRVVVDWNLILCKYAKYAHFGVHKLVSYAFFFFLSVVRSFK